MQCRWEESHPHRCREDTPGRRRNRGQLPLLDIRYTTTNPMIPRATMLRLKIDGRVSSHCSQVTEGVQGCAVEFVLGLSQHHGQYKLEARHHQDYTRSLVMICL